MDPKKPKVIPLHRRNDFKKVRGLKCFQQAHEMICEGYPLREVARFIQEEKKEYLDVSKESLMVHLNNYRNSIPKGELLRKSMPRSYAKAVEKLNEEVDALKELRKLYLKQLERINIDIGNEKKIGKLLPSMPPEMKTTMEMLSRIAQLEMDLGISKRHLGQIDVDAKIVADVEHKYSLPEVSKVLSNPESRRKLLGIANQFLALAKKPEEITAEVVEEEVVPVETVPQEDQEAVEQVESGPEDETETP